MEDDAHCFLPLSISIGLRVLEPWWQTFNDVCFTFSTIRKSEKKSRNCQKTDFKFRVCLLAKMSWRLLSYS